MSVRGCWWPRIEKRASTVFSSSGCSTPAARAPSARSTAMRPAATCRSGRRTDASAELVDQVGDRLDYARGSERVPLGVLAGGHAGQHEDGLEPGLEARDHVG